MMDRNRSKQDLRTCELLKRSDNLQLNQLWKLDAVTFSKARLGISAFMGNEFWIIFKHCAASLIQSCLCVLYKYTVHTHAQAQVQDTRASVKYTTTCTRRMCVHNMHTYKCSYLDTHTQICCETNWNLRMHQPSTRHNLQANQLWKLGTMKGS